MSNRNMSIRWQAILKRENRELKSWSEDIYEQWTQQKKEKYQVYLSSFNKQVFKYNMKLKLHSLLGLLQQWLIHYQLYLQI